MKIAVASAGAGGLDDTVSPVFETSPSFTLVDANDQEIVSVAVVVNQTGDVIGAAVAELSRDLAGRGVDAVIAGEFGSEAVGVFTSAGISMYRLQDMPVGDAVKQLLNRATGTVRATGRGTVPTGYTTRVSGPPGFGRQRRAGRGPR